MKKLGRLVMGLALLTGCAGSASAQYYQMANQATNMLSTIFQGGFNYRGMVDASYVRGLGDRRADFLELTTTQGVKYSSWFYMGVGAGVDVLFAHTDSSFLPPENQMGGKGLTTSACMIPLYSDFRFLIGKESSTSLFIDLRLGCSFLMGKDYVQINDGYITRSECFYFKPSIGLRLPVNRNNPKQAVNLGLSYNLVSSNYWSAASRDINLSSLGLTVGFEW